MEGKKKVNIYTDWNESIKDLSNVEAGKLFKHLLAYVNDENPKELTGKLKFVWIPIKQTLKRDLQKWLKTCEKNRDNANKRWRSDATASDGMRSDAKNADKDKDIDKDIDRDSIYKLTPENLNTILSSESLNVAIKSLRLARPEIGRYLFSVVFWNEQKAAANTYKSMHDCIGHFINWYKKTKPELTDEDKRRIQKAYPQKYEELEG